MHIKKQYKTTSIHCPFDFIFFALYLYFCFAISLKSGEPLKGRRKFQHLGTWYHLFLLSTTDTHNVIAWSLKQPKFFMKTNWYAYIQVLFSSFGYRVKKIFEESTTSRIFTHAFSSHLLWQTKTQSTSLTRVGLSYKLIHVDVHSPCTNSILLIIAKSH